MSKPTINNKPTLTNGYSQKTSLKDKYAQDNLILTNKRFTAVLDGLNAAVYVADMESHEILLVNRFMCNHFGDIQGKKCWQVLQGSQAGPCEFCTNSKLVDSHGNATGVFVWQHYNSLLDKKFELFDQAIPWVDGRLVRVEIAFDVTELDQSRKKLFRANAIMRTVNFAAEQLSIQEDWNMAVHEVLKRLGEAADVSRAYMFRNHTDPGEELLTSQLYEWVSPGISPQIDNPDLQDMSYIKTGFKRWQEILGNGLAIYGPVKELPKSEQLLLSSHDIKSIAVVPITIDGGCWGFVGFDDCREEREWSSMEIDGLQTAANILGDAIKRQIIEEELHQQKARYLAVVNDQSELIYRYLSDGTLTFVNQAYCCYFGKTKEELLGRSFFTLIPPGNHDALKRHIKSLNVKKPSATVEHQIITPAGDYRWQKWTDRAIFDDNSNIVEYQAVGSDITKRKQNEEKKQKVNIELEERVQQRTTEILITNRLLSQEISERKKAARELKRRTRELEESNTALKVLLKRGADAKRELEEKVTANVRELVVPYIDEMKVKMAHRRDIAYLDVIRNNLEEIISPFSHELTSKYLGLSPREIQIADLTRQGKTNKDIAQLLTLSIRTVESYRDSMREKLGIKNKKINLRTYLLNLPQGEDTDD